MSKIVVIVVPVFNQLLYTKRLLESIDKHKFSAFDALHTVIVDNGSNEETSKYLVSWATKDLSENRSRILIVNKENRGFGPAINQAIERCAPIKPNYLVMNNDMELIDGCLDTLYTTAYEKEDTGIVGGKLLFPDGRIQHGGAFLSVLGWGQHIGGGLREDNGFFGAEKKECEYVTGALFFIRADLASKLPGFDEQFAPAYFEEVDYCYGARQLGYKVLYTPDARAYHYENTTGKEVYGSVEEVKKKLSDTNQIKFYLKQEDRTLQYEPTSDKRLLMSCRIYGDWSFSIVMRNLARGLQRSGVDVSIAPEEYHTIANMDDWEIKQMINKPNDWWDRVVLRSAEGDHMYLMPPGKKRVAHTTGESSRVSKQWLEQLNHTDLVLTTSTFFQDVLINSGLQTPVRVLPNAVDITKYNPNVKRAKINNDFRGTNFLSMFAWGDRKNPDALFRAFIEEFSPEDNVTLTVHSLSMEWVLSQSGSSVRQYVRDLAGGKKHAPIFVTSKSIHDVVLPNFIKNFDVNVLATRGEGFGNSVLECAAIGIPSIVTGYSGVTDFVKPEEEVGWAVDYKLVDIPLQHLPYFRNYIGGQWAEIDIADLRSKLRFAHNNTQIVKKFGKNATAKAQNYSIEAVGAMARDYIFGDIV